MPTFTAIALESLLEPRNRQNSSNLKPEFCKNRVDTKEGGDGEETKKKRKPSYRIYISPALYTTPEPTPIRYSSSLGSISPSPYIYKPKGRGGKTVSCRIDGLEVQQQTRIQRPDEPNEIGDELQVADKTLDGILFEGEMVEGGNENSAADVNCLCSHCDSVSVASSTEVNDFGSQGESKSFLSNHGEFFDAMEEFSSDGSISNTLHFGQSIESELQATRLDLLEEIDRRKTAEDALGMMYSHWQRVCHILLPQASLPLPLPPKASCSSMQLENSLEQLSQEVIVARFVAEALGKGEGRVEAELAAAAIIESKDQEIARLRDRLHYYKSMNNEMSRRNLEAMEVSRRQRARRRGQRKWFWGCLGVSIAIGASVCILLPSISKRTSFR